MIFVPKIMKDSGLVMSFSGFDIRDMVPLGYKPVSNPILFSEIQDTWLISFVSFFLLNVCYTSSVKVIWT